MACKSANDGPLFSDFSEGAAWVDSFRTHDSYMTGLTKLPWLSLVPGFHLSMVQPDIMHVLHLGVCSFAVGSELIILCGRGHFGNFTGNQHVRLASALRAAYARFGAYCASRAVSTSQLCFTPGM
eukprot:7253139-Alexandrium_andersonii.AAC.1